MALRPIIENWQHAVSEVTEDMLEEIGIGIDEVRTVVLRVIPLPREWRLEKGTFSNPCGGVGEEATATDLDRGRHAATKNSGVWLFCRLDEDCRTRLDCTRSLVTVEETHNDGQTDIYARSFYYCE